MQIVGNNNLHKILRGEHQAFAVYKIPVWTATAFVIIILVGLECFIAPKHHSNVPGPLLSHISILRETPTYEHVGKSIAYRGFRHLDMKYLGR
jgi:hypothetical protein